LKRARVVRTELARERERELVQEAVKLRGMSPTEALEVMSELVEFAIKMNKVTEKFGEAKDDRRRREGTGRRP
jgi:flagellar motor switch protein FliG